MGSRMNQDSLLVFLAALVALWAQGAELYPRRWAMEAMLPGVRRFLMSAMAGGAMRTR